MITVQCKECDQELQLRSDTHEKIINGQEEVLCGNCGNRLVVHSERTQAGDPTVMVLVGFGLVILAIVSSLGGYFIEAFSAVLTVALLFGVIVFFGGGSGSSGPPRGGRWDI